VPKPGSQHPSPGDAATPTAQRSTGTTAGPAGTAKPSDASTAPHEDDAKAASRSATHVAAERARDGQPGDASEKTEALRAEIEQTRAEMGETAAALVTKLDVPARVKEAATEKTQHVKQAVAEKTQHLKDATAEKSQQVKETATEKAQQLKDATAEKSQQVKETATEKVQQLRDATDNGPQGREAATGTRPDDSHAGGTEHSRRQSTAETRAHIAESAAEAAERATTAIGTLPGRATEAIGTLRDRAAETINAFPDRVDQRQRYGLIGAAAVVAAVAVILIRRLR
jgi:hypothetical protein